METYNTEFDEIIITFTDQNGRPLEIEDGSSSVSNIQDYIEYIIKKHETLTAIPSIHVYINKINNRLVFKTKDGYKLELQTPESMKLSGSTEKINRQNKKMGKMCLVLK